MRDKILLITRRVLILLLIIWMIVVFMLSSQPGEESGTLSKKVALLITFGNDETADSIEPTVRKIAHVTEFAIGAMIFYGILITYDKYSLKAKIIITISFIVIYAGLDEFHQTFIYDRAGNWIDIIIDTFGGALGTGATFLVEACIRIMDEKINQEINGK